MSKSLTRKIWAIGLTLILILVLTIAKHFGIDVDVPDVLPAEP